MPSSTGHIAGSGGGGLTSVPFEGERSLSGLGDDDVRVPLGHVDGVSWHGWRVGAGRTYDGLMRDAILSVIRSLASFAMQRV